MFYSNKLKFIRSKLEVISGDNLMKFNDYSISILESLIEDILIDDVNNVMIQGTRNSNLQEFLNKYLLDKNIEFNDFNLNKEYDIIISFMDIHLIKDIREYLFAISNMLSKKGVFLGVFLSDNTMVNLRNKLWEFENEVNGNYSLRVNPMLRLKDFTSLMYSNNFTNLISFKDEISLEFPSLYNLIENIRKFGDNVVFEKSEQMPKELAKKIIIDNNNFVENFDIVGFCGSKSSRLLATKINN